MENQNDDRNLFALIATALGFLAWALCRHFGQPQYGRAAYLTTGVVFLVIVVRWGDSNGLWFWEVILGLAALQVPLTMIIAKTTERWSFPLLFYPGVADMIAMFVVIEFVRPRGDTPKDKNLRR